MYRPKTIYQRLIVICLVGIVIIFLYHSDIRLGNEINRQTLISVDLLNSSSGAQVPRLIVIGQDPFDTKKPIFSHKSANLSCQIPKLDTFNAEISKLLQKPRLLGCSDEPLWLNVDSDNRIVLTEYAKNEGITVDNIKCSIHFYERVNDDVLNWTSIKKVEIGASVELSENFLVNCTHGKRIWKHLFMNLVPRQKFVERAKGKEHDPDWSGLNVLFMGFDSLSQQAFRRNLPITVEYLEKEMESVVLNGYNIVGDGTPQAFIPILTAKTEEELPLTRKRYPNASFVDVYPFIWRNYTDAGYITLYAEDAAAVGTFTYRLKGFKEQPTDHYTRTFFQFAEKFERRWQCNGPIPQHKIWFKYASDFMRKYDRDVPKFAVMHHSLLSHDDINKVQHADSDLKNLIEGLNNDGLLKNTVFILMADHGHRFSALRSTQQEFRQTERGALMYKNLKTNANRLSTPFDVHATLMNILKLPSTDELSMVQSSSKRSLSLFTEIPASRSCEQADILPHWCTCLRWESAYDTEDKRAISNMLAHSAINGYTSSERKLCAELKLAGVQASKWLIPEDDLMKYHGVKDQDGFVADLSGNTTATFGIYNVRFKTVPGNAVYDASLSYNSVSNEVVVDFRSISHINAFGDAPHCIIDKNYFLATYCVCYDRI